MPSSPVIQLQQINKYYGNTTHALKQLDFQAQAGEIIGIVGANGSGKSTLLKVIAGTVNINSGKRQLFQLDSDKNAEKLKQQIGYLSQHQALDPEMTGKELLNYFAALYGLNSEQSRQRQQQLSDSFQLKDFLTRRVKTYSGGQAQRLHLAIGIIQQPQLLLMDEPTTGLDPDGKHFFWNFVKNYSQQGNTLMIISHELDSVRQYCSRVVFINKAKIIADDSPDQLIQQYSSPQLYIKTNRIIVNSETIKLQLQVKLPQANITINKQIIRLDIKANSVFQPEQILNKTLNLLQNLALAILECRWQQADLKTAYFKLSGSKISQSPTPQRGKTKLRAAP